MSRPRVLLTNDDGIDAVGLAALHDTLQTVADVTVVAPLEDRSGVGRKKSYETPIHEHDLGVALEGTPADCVQAGLDRYTPDADLVMAGINPGPNIGEHVVGRSGTVGAAREAAFSGVPGVAVSLYDPPHGARAFEYDDFAEAGRFARHVVTDGLGSGLFEAAPVLNVNVPVEPASPTTVRLTRPAESGTMETREDDGVLTFHDTFYDDIRPGPPGEVTDPVGTDIRACDDVEISVTPLGRGVATVDPERLDGALDGYES